MKKIRVFLIVFIFIMVGVGIAFAAGMVDISGDKDVLTDIIVAISEDASGDKIGNTVINLSGDVEALTSVKISNESKNLPSTNSSEDKIAVSEDTESSESGDNHDISLVSPSGKMFISNSGEAKDEETPSVEIKIQPNEEETSGDEIETQPNKEETSGYEIGIQPNEEETSGDEIGIQPNEEVTSGDKIETQTNKEETSGNKIETQPNEEATSGDNTETQPNEVEISGDKVETQQNEEETSGDKVETLTNKEEKPSGEIVILSEEEKPSGEIEVLLKEEKSISGEQIEEESGEAITQYVGYPKEYINVYIKDVLVENNNVIVSIEDKDCNYLDSAIYHPKDYYHLMALTNGMQIDAEIVCHEEKNILEFDYIKFKNSIDSGTLISKNNLKDGKVVFMVNGKDYLMNDDKLNLQKNEFVILETIDCETVSRHNGNYVLKKVPTGGVFVDSKEDIEKISDDAFIFEISERQSKKITKEEVKINSVYTKIDLTKRKYLSS